mmetsp:Transcript_30426/g.59763  ORF Transcript_30426/g.59763 Transcript_30426/m.59763 type:complete len:236 (-) Transcript_30426:325-1032(-)
MVRSRLVSPLLSSPHSCLSNWLSVCLPACLPASLPACPSGCTRTLPVLVVLRLCESLPARFTTRFLCFFQGAAKTAMPLRIHPTTFHYPFLLFVPSLSHIPSRTPRFDFVRAWLPAFFFSLPLRPADFVHLCPRTLIASVPSPCRFLFFFFCGCLCFLFLLHLLLRYLRVRLASYGDALREWKQLLTVSMNGTREKREKERERGSRFSLVTDLSLTGVVRQELSQTSVGRFARVE